MSIEPEEAQAIAEAFRATRPATSVAPRDFAEPRRLSADGLARLSRAVGAALAGVSEALQVPLRRGHKLSLVALREVNAAATLDGLEEPFAVLGFAVGKRRGWLVWDSAPAAALVETILAGSPGGEGARRLSPAERRLLESTLDRVLRPVASALGCEADGLRFAQVREELASLEAALDDDPQRVCVQLAFEGPGGPSELRLYVPGVRVAVAGAPAPAPAAPPEHLDEVTFDLRAYLGSTDVPLSDLLALEVGDVVPLGVRRGEPVRVCIEDRTCAEARLGRLGSRLAVRIEALDLRACEDDPPSY